ncbi:Chemocyanin [Apostasia shenzhenica]|uniref:Chemocyanin n=1 Tax=Apostasia shenzhenica TaxID=1088818 RepID=A0A2I0AD73_9ASPA|nr:Chemocyanin [Apostasia shenzhenica]
MVQGSGKVVRAVAICLPALLLLLLLNGDVAESRFYTVGDDAGWRDPSAVKNWAANKTFYPDDEFFFQFTPGQQSLMQVNENGYRTCKYDPNLPTYLEGSITFKLTGAGNYYFISTVNNGCENGLKLWIKVSQPKN